MTTVMKMPSSYVDVSKKEMEYDGGIAWVAIGAAVWGISTLVNIGATFAGSMGWIDANTASTIAYVSSIVGAVSGCVCGIGALCATAAKQAGTITVTQALKAGYNIAVKPGAQYGYAAYQYYR